MRNLFVTPDEAAALIRGGAAMVVAGVEDLLTALPRGRWIGGTTPYFVTAQGGTVDSERLFCTVIEPAEESRIAILPADHLHEIGGGRFEHGFTYLILPGMSAALQRYAVEAPGFPGLYEQPLMGWIAGVHLAEIGKRTPKVVDGSSGAVAENAGVALHVRLPARVAADVDIINIFSQGDGPALVFPSTGFSANACMIDGRPGRLADAIDSVGGDTRLPLVADYAGAMVNVSIQSVDAASGEVKLYAPVVAGETYRLARPVGDIAAAYTTGVGAPDGAGDMLSCNCILNFLYAALEGKSTGGFVGPVTFGEIAYNLVNQTLVRMQLVPNVATADLQPA